MSTALPVTLEDAIRQSGEGWLLDSFSPREAALDHLRRTLETVQDMARARFGSQAPDFTEATIIAEARRIPAQVRAFFQALGRTRTPEILLMAWRIIQGMEIKEIQFSYHRKHDFDVRIVLESPYGEIDPPYLSSNVNDFSIFRHLGALEVDGAPVLDGFYALKMR